MVKLEDFGDVFEPAEAAEPILARGVRLALTEWLTEIWAEAELHAVGIGPRRRGLLSGKPGVGKTTLAHHLAARLGIRMLAVRPERLIGKYVGETGKNIGELFHLASPKKTAGGEKPPEPVMLFLDEVDAIAGQRRAAEQAADDDRNNGVDTLLQQIEQYQGYLIAATNYPDRIDQAIWRRFDMHITLELPGQGERERILALYLAPFVLPRRPLTVLAESFETASPALMRQFCENLKRTLIVGPLINADMGREATIERVIASIKPHPDLGVPALWSRGGADPAVKTLPWPLSREAIGEAEAMALAAENDDDGNVTPLRRRR